MRAGIRLFDAWRYPLIEIHGPCTCDVRSCGLVDQSDIGRKSDCCLGSRQTPLLIASALTSVFDETIGTSEYRFWKYPVLPVEALNAVPESPNALPESPNTAPEVPSTAPEVPFTAPAVLTSPPPPLQQAEPFASIVTSALFAKLSYMLDDSTIVRRVLAGETDAFAWLVDRHHARCLRTATHLLGDADDAEDAVQDAFVRAYRHLGSYREQDRFGAWLLRIVVNQCRTNAAKQARYTRLGDDATTTNACEARPSHDLVAQTEHDAQRAELSHALAQLGAEQREAIVLRFTEELSYDEMASITGVGVSALKMRVQRACAALRSLLTEQFHV